MNTLHQAVATQRDPPLVYPPWFIACVAGGIRQRASGGGAAIYLAREFASGEAASEIQLDSSPILSRLRHLRSPLRY